MRLREECLGFLAAERLPSDLGHLQPVALPLFDRRMAPRGVLPPARDVSRIPGDSADLQSFDRHEQLPAVWNADDRRPDHVSRRTVMVDDSEAGVGSSRGRTASVGYVGCGRTDRAVLEPRITND